MRYPTLSEFQTALKLADLEDYNSRDSSLLMRYLEYFANNNPRIKGHIKTREAAISSWGWEIIDYDGIRLNDIENRVAAAIRTIIAGTVSAALFGGWMARIEWVYSDAYNAWFARIIPLPLKSFDTLPNGAFLLKSGDNRFRIEIDDSNFIRINDGSSMMGGIMRSLGELEILRRDAIFEWGNYLRKLKGLIQGIDKGADDEEKNIAKAALRMAVENNYMFTSDLIDFKFHNLAASAGTSFKDFIDHINSAISIAILGQANTSELPAKSGSRAALSIQKLLTDDIMFSDIETLERTINEQLLIFDYAKHFGGGLPNYRFRVKLEEIEDYETNAVVIREALSAGVPLKKSEVYSKLGFSQPSDLDDVFHNLS